MEIINKTKNTMQDQENQKPIILQLLENKIPFSVCIINDYVLEEYINEQFILIHKKDYEKLSLNGFSRTQENTNVYTKDIGVDEINVFEENKEKFKVVKKEDGFVIYELIRLLFMRYIIRLQKEKEEKELNNRLEKQNQARIEKKENGSKKRTRTTKKKAD